MTIMFSALTILTLLLVSILAQATGMAAGSYFVLALVLGAYMVWRSRKQLATVKAEVN